MCAKVFFFHPLLNICVSKLKQSLLIYFKNMRKLPLNTWLGHLGVSSNKTVSWTLVLNVNQLIKRESENLRHNMPIRCLLFGKWLFVSYVAFFMLPSNVGRERKNSPKIHLVLCSADSGWKQMPRKKYKNRASIWWQFPKHTFNHQ